MSNSDRLRKILVPGVKITPCIHCGEGLASIEGNVFDNCKDWAEYAMSRMPAPQSFSMVLPIVLIRKLCRLEQLICQQAAAVDNLDPR